MRAKIYIFPQKNIIYEGEGDKLKKMFAELKNKENIDNLDLQIVILLLSKHIKQIYKQYHISDKKLNNILDFINDEYIKEYMKNI